jgi:hypothetical protein
MFPILAGGESSTENEGDNKNNVPYSLYSRNEPTLIMLFKKKSFLR